MSENVTISAKQNKAIESLLATANVSRAAKDCGVSRKTLYRWQRQPEFSAELRRRQHEALDLVIMALGRLAHNAVVAYADALDPGVDIGTRLRSADSVLDRLLRMRDSLDLEERIAALEDAINAQS